MGDDKDVEDDDHSDSMSDDEITGPKFKVIVEKAQPAGVKISRKNACIVEIINHELEIKNDEEHIQLINYFMGQKQPTSGAQFMQALMLSPKVDENDLIVEEVSTYEAIMHFVTMFWKLLFAFIPPTQWGNTASRPSSSP